MTRARNMNSTLNSWGDAFASLEPRVLLSHGDGGVPGTSLSQLEWHGQSIDVVLDSWIVTFDAILGQQAAVERAQAVAAGLGIRVQDIRAIGRGGYAMFTSLDPIRETDISRVLSRVGGVVGLEPNVVYQPQAIPNDPLLSRQWGLVNTGQEVPPGSGNAGVFGADAHAAAAWDRTIGSESTIVAIIDTGIDLTHPDLDANIWRNPGEVANDGIDNDGNGFIDDVRGYDFGDGDNIASDPTGHGTEVAGVIGAVGNNNTGITGVAWSVSMLPVKVARASLGNAIALDAVIAAHDYVTAFITNAGRNIVASNNSYGGLLQAGYQAAEEDAIRRFTDTGATFVAAAGNQAADLDQNDAFYPASYRENNPAIIVVAATTNRDELAFASNYGRAIVDLGAPGEDTFTTMRGGGFGLSTTTTSTSFSAAYVTGAVALLKTVKPNASSDEVRRALIRGVDTIDALQDIVSSGGRLNIASALRNILIEGPTVTGISPGSVSSNITNISISFSEVIASPVLASSITLVRSNGDGMFGNGNDVTITITQPMLSVSGNVLTIDLSGLFPDGVPIDNYRLTLAAGGIQDLDGNFLNGTTAAPIPSDDEVYFFQAITSSGAFEPNDSTGTATPIIFSSSGRAIFTGAVIGDGSNNARDVDVYRFTLNGPGLIVATIDARSLPLPSMLDSVLTLYNTTGLAQPTAVFVARNDNFNGLDSRLEFFVPTGGNYFLVVSGFGNDDFDPRVPGSGTREGSIGDYNLTVDVAIDTTDTVVYDATGLPLQIPDPVVGTPSPLLSSIDIFDTRRISDLNVRLTITHQFVSDLQVRLRHHIEGADPLTDRVVPLVLARGGAGDDFIDTVFDDEAATTITTAAAPFTGSFRPESPLNRFDGQTAAGVWTLEVTDTRAPNVGTLVSWGLGITVINNVFGPFELNDTLGLVPTPILTVPGTATLDAFIGDGAFGLRDVDLYRVDAPAGTTLTASITVPPNFGDPVGGPSSNHLDSVLRLFDSTGRELVLDNRAGTQNSSLTFTVDPGGTYYVGVSGASNVSYSILSGASGTATTATGNYRLQVSISGGISGGATVLHGNEAAVSVGLNADGSIGVPTGIVNTNEQPRGITLGANEFILSDGGPSESLFGATYNGFSFQNAGPSGRSDLQVTVSNESDPFNQRVTITGLFRGLSVRRTLSYGINDRFVAVDVSLTNTTPDNMSDVAWVEAFNPQTGLNRQSTIARTTNNVDNATGRLVTASFTDNDFPNGLTIGLAGAATPVGTRLVTAVMDLGSIRDPFQVLDNDNRDPDTSGADVGVNSDQLIALAFGTEGNQILTAGSELSFRYFILLGSSVGEVQNAFAALEADTGTGHFVQDPEEADPLRGYNPATGTSTLPYALYYPEGYANNRASTFVPIVNPNDTSARVVIIARYERGDASQRDQILYDSATGDIDGNLLVDGTVPAHSRTGLTITTPAQYSAGTMLVRPDEPYSLEIRSSKPLAANLSHFDFGVSTGESFSNDTSDVWTFGEGYFGAGINDFLVYYNPGTETIKVTLTIYPEFGGPAFSLISQEVEGLRRGGWSLNDALQGRIAPNTPFGIKVVAEAPIVAALTHFDTNLAGGFGVLGTAGLGTLTGATPEGQLGISAGSEFVTILNANATAANINFTFFFQNGSAYRHSLTVPANRRGGFSVAALPNFPIGQQGYSISFSSSVPVTMTLPSFSHGEATGSQFSGRASSTWLFGDGFRPLVGNQVAEYLRLFNPTTQALSVEITLDFNDGSTETFRRSIAPSAANEFNVHDFVTGYRRTDGTVPGIGSFYGITVKASQPIVAYMAHFDANFFGGFGTLGVPLGTTRSLS
ncbi:MAG: S8 family serine peptidase [Pyrinomonadaceae bacterium]|nr:S8 family serine peptidase [Phycisphaerales bacterium]